MQNQNTLYTMRIFCLIYGEPVDYAFSVSLNGSGTVEDLRAQIRSSRRFFNISIEDIILWKVNISVDMLETFDPKADITTLEGKKLLLVQNLSKIFTNDECVQIIVQIPPSIRVSLYRDDNDLQSVESMPCHIFTWHPRYNITLQNLWNTIGNSRTHQSNSTLKGAIIKNQSMPLEEISQYVILKEDTDLIKVLGNSASVELSLIVKKNDDHQKNDLIEENIKKVQKNIVMDKCWTRSLQRLWGDGKV